jgi:hypothetical protein
MAISINNLFSGDDNPKDGIAQVCKILALLEDKTNNIVDLQAQGANHEYYLSRKGVDGQQVLYGLLRETLEQAAARIKHSE